MIEVIAVNEAKEYAIRLHGKKNTKTELKKEVKDNGVIRKQ